MTYSKERTQCAGCGDFVNVHGDGWRALADGAIVHDDGRFGQRCYTNYQELKRQQRKIVNPLDVLRKEFGSDLVERDGAYWLYGSPIKFNDLMRALNTRFLARGDAQIKTNPAWVVDRE